MNYISQALLFPALWVSCGYHLPFTLCQQEALILKWSRGEKPLSLLLEWQQMVMWALHIRSWILQWSLSFPDIHLIQSYRLARKLAERFSVLPTPV